MTDQGLIDEAFAGYAHTSEILDDDNGYTDYEAPSDFEVIIIEGENEQKISNTIWLSRCDGEEAIYEAIQEIFNNIDTLEQLCIDGGDEENNNDGDIRRSNVAALVVSESLFQFCLQELSKVIVIAPNLQELKFENDLDMTIESILPLYSLVTDLKANAPFFNKVSFSGTKFTTEAIQFLALQQITNNDDNNNNNNLTISIRYCLWEDIEVDDSDAQVFVHTKEFPNNVILQLHHDHVTVQTAHLAMQGCCELANESNMDITCLEFCKALVDLDAIEYLLNQGGSSGSGSIEDFESLQAEFKDCKVQYNNNSNNDNDINGDEELVGIFNFWNDTCSMEDFQIMELAETKSLSNILQRVIRTNKLKEMNFENSTIALEVLSDLFLPVVNTVTTNTLVKFINCTILNPPAALGENDEVSMTLPTINELHWTIGATKNDSDTMCVPSETIIVDNCESIRTVMFMIANCPPFNHVTSLKLHGNKIGKVGAKIVTKFLNETKLQQLDLSDTALAKKCFEALVTTLQSNNNIVRLDISQNYTLTAAGIVSLLDHNKIQELILRDLNKRNGVMKLLADALITNTSLELLDISDNTKITAAAMASFLELLQSGKNKTLKQIKFDNACTVEGPDDIELMQMLSFYLKLNQIGRRQLLQGVPFPISLFAYILERANEDPSAIYWVTKTVPHLLLVGPKRK